MGIDYLVCSVCRKAFADMEDYRYCEECDNHICESCSDKFNIEEDEDDDKLLHCPICNKKVFTDEVVMLYALEKLMITKEALIEEMKNQNDKLE